MARRQSPSTVGRLSRVKTKRRPFRRDQILAAAVTLFYERGYHATSVDEIGAAVGISGSGVYRHFRSKKDILETALGQVGPRVIQRTAEIIGEEADPRGRLEALVDNLVDALIDEPILAALVLTESRSLERRVRNWFERARRQQIEVWSDALKDVRPELKPKEVDLMVTAAMAIATSVSDRPRDIDPSAGPLLKNMVMGALFAKVPDDAGRG